MRLRTEPPRVTRLSRKMLAGVGAVALLGIGGALIYALQTRDAGPGGEELYSTENRPTADGLSGLPRDYTGPVLGPALPGDLGGPILDAQNRGQPVAPPAMATPVRDPAEERRLAEEEAARLSTVFFQSGQRTATAPGSNIPGLAGLGVGGQPATRDRHTAFLNGPVDRQTVALDRIMAPASPYILQAGAVIPAAMITGIRSDLPGQITAQVTENVYDSPTGSLLLIPQGTRIIGQYDAGVTFGQRRVLLVWNRLILPNGRSIVLERQPGADASGYAGLEDGVDYHWWDLMKAAGLSTLLGIGTELATDDEDRLIRAIRDGAQDTINQAGQQIVQRQLQVAPTLTIRPGFPVRVIVTRDLVLEPYRN
ncbi:MULTISPECIES: TrbI/VirB10 family protein [Alphaproteobacteria]|nr:conjugal transfer protein TraI [Sphingomonas sanxanigenens DSM 19645 = NX02]MBS90386.1 conjugal transfer protein TraI [Sphingobium sp.]MED5544879.1 TrbI/VirB10 family protein [Pseudomonadota bacterium]QWT15980.1 TrbI/VirB10 family protein [Sphingobium xenophagum]MBS90592.1 conjugal transfer protein TraI [Sphingobium sp.]